MVTIKEWDVPLLLEVDRGVTIPEQDPFSLAVGVARQRFPKMNTMFPCSAMQHSNGFAK
jgi:hypothetical protein